jgi:hypothetical protein
MLISIIKLIILVVTLNLIINPHESMQITLGQNRKRERPKMTLKGNKKNSFH